jgi:hypothetical protein
VFAVSGRSLRVLLHLAVTGGPLGRGARLSVLATDLVVVACGAGIVGLFVAGGDGVRITTNRRKALRERLTA